MTQFIMIGAGGHASALLSALRLCNADVIGYVAEKDSIMLKGISRIGGDDKVIAHGPDGVLLLNGIGSVNHPARRRDIFVRYKKLGFAFASVVHPSAIIAAEAVHGEGAQIMAGAILQSGVRIGDNVIVNTGAIVDHDCQVGDHVHIATGARLAGDVIIGGAAHIGTGSTIIQGVSIGGDAVVAGGAVVITDVAAGSVVMGVPARARIT
jgi:UDP-perosamine 4-acetyltransferase